MNIVIMVTVVSLRWPMPPNSSWVVQGVEYAYDTYMSWRGHGQYSWAFWALIICNILIPACVVPSRPYQLLLGGPLHRDHWGCGSSARLIVLACIGNHASGWTMFIRPGGCGHLLGTIGIFFTLYLFRPLLPGMALTN